MFSSRISAGELAILTEDFRGFPQYLEANSGTLPSNLIFISRFTLRRYLRQMLTSVSMNWNKIQRQLQDLFRPHAEQVGASYAASGVFTSWCRHVKTSCTHSIFFKVFLGSRPYYSICSHVPSSERFVQFYWCASVSLHTDFIFSSSFVTRFSLAQTLFPFHATSINVFFTRMHLSFFRVRVPYEIVSAKHSSIRFFERVGHQPGGP